MEYNKELLDKFLNEKYAVAVRTEQEWIDFMELLESETQCLWSGKCKPKDYNSWFNYGTESSITYNSHGDYWITFADNDFYTRKGYEIIEYQELIKIDLFDIIDKPKHYADKNIEVIEYIEDTLVNNNTLTAYEGYLIGNIIKYLSRAGLKDSKEQDFKKAKYYLDRLNK